MKEEHGVIDHAHSQSDVARKCYRPCAIHWSHG